MKNKLAIKKRLVNNISDNKFFISVTTIAK